MNPDFDPFLNMLNGAMAKMSEERKANATNMRLGQFIDALAACDSSLPLALENGSGLGNFMSYRGYYEDLSIAPSPTVLTVGETLAAARAALGEVFEGYKGGDFPMSKLSLLWVAPYGGTGDKLASVEMQADRVVVRTAPDDPL